MAAAPKPVSTPVILVLIAGAIVILGSVGPWKTVGPVGESGMDGKGVITLVLGIALVVLAALSLRTWDTLRAVGALLLAAACAAVGAYEWLDVAGEEQGFFRPQVEAGWGVILTTIAGGAGAAAAIWSFLARTNARTAEASTPEVF
jgi:hypothetical protein